MAFTTQDYSTFNFLQWYVAEQHEEEKLFKSIVDRLSLVGEDGKGLYFIDKELAELARAPLPASWTATPDSRGHLVFSQYNTAPRGPFSIDAAMKPPLWFLPDAMTVPWQGPFFF